jgi:hypothetical protein
MTDNSQDIAKQFLNMWQQQVASSMHEPANMPNMMQTMTQMQQSFMANGGMANANPAANPNPYAAHHQPDPQHGNGELLQLERRLRECEARVAVLESKLGERR